MRLIVNCPTEGCGQSIDLEGRRVGERVTCASCNSDFSANDVPFERDGRYRLDKCISGIGMGLVFLARDSQDQQTILKVPRLGLGYESHLLEERFETEIRAIRRLKHENICEILNDGEWMNNVYFTMPYLTGGTLADRIHADFPLPIQDVVRWVSKVARGMAYSHGMGVVHRDLKPSNIIFDDRGELKITDFGLALFVDNRDAARKTREGMSLGTLAYAPPELINGEVELHGEASDIYSLGVILYEALTGRRPFSGEWRAIEDAILKGAKAWPRDLRYEIDAKLQRICLTAMEPQIGNRYKSMDAFVKDIDDYRQRLSLCPEIAELPKHSIFRSGQLPVEMIHVPSGEFFMGSEEDVDERPRRKVQIAAPFLFAVYTVTQEQYMKVAGQLPPQHAQQGGRKPVSMVTWLDAIVFCNLLSEMDGLPLHYRIMRGDVVIVGGNGYRLPTEAEWEYACRAGGEGHYCFGDDPSLLEEYAWFVDNSRGSPQDVGQLTPNAFGLHDMHGNIWEWCWDWYTPDGHRHRRDGEVDRGGVPTGRHRVLRGGCWGSDSWVVRCASRLDFPPDGLPLPYNGFRLARSP
jgi:sulfatase modifying factor 1